MMKFRNDSAFFLFFLMRCENVVFELKFNYLLREQDFLFLTVLLEGGLKLETEIPLPFFVLVL